MSGECSNCRAPQVCARGLCKACYNYQWTHGTMRPPVRGRLRAQAKACRNCKEGAPMAHSLCAACYRYQRRNGRNRPHHLYRESCKICGKPGREPRKWVRGRCNTCHNYWRKMGKDRSERLIKRCAPLGWCECGQPAAEQVALNGTRMGGYVYPLCKDCAALEREGINV